MVVLGWPGYALDLCRAGEPAALRVYLRGVRQQRLVPDAEVVTAGHPRGDLVPRPAAVVVIVGPVLEPVSVRGLKAAPDHLLVQRHEPRAVEGEEVVELERLPGLAAAGIPIGVGGRLEGLHRHLVG